MTKIKNKDSLKIEKFKEKKREEKMGSCIICLNEYKNEDLILTLSCSRKHYFH